MLLNVSKDSDMNAAIEKANKFLTTLKFGQWYSTQMNPLLAISTKVETNDDGTKTIIDYHKYEWVVVTYYLDETELAMANKKASNLLSG